MHAWRYCLHLRGIVWVGLVAFLWLLPEKVAASGGISFNPGVVITNTIAGAHSVYAADMDRDGDMDVLSASGADDTIAWYENDGTAFPAFTGHIIANNADGAIAVYATDLDNDGDVDALSAGDGGEVAWYENGGSLPLMFTKHVITTTAAWAKTVYVVDMDSDGDQDVLSISFMQDTVTWYENEGNPSPSFTGHTITNTADCVTSAYAADMDGDGDIDVLSSSEQDDKIAWYENDGQTLPTFSSHIITTTADGAHSVYATDVNGDGDMDIVAASWQNDQVAWYENDGANPPSFTYHLIADDANGAWAVYAADMDNDGDVDILSASQLDDKIAWYENDGAASPLFSSHVVTTTADAAEGVYAADVDSDGDLDILSVSEFDNKVVWYPNEMIHRSAYFPVEGHAVITDTTGDARSVYAADMNRDGDMDVLSASYNDAKIAWYENNGTPYPDTAPPTFSDHVLPTNATYARSVYAADVNGDGHLDILSAYSNSIAWHASDGATPPNYSDILITTTAMAAYSVYAADVDSDGDMDALSASYLDDKVTWYENISGDGAAFTGHVITTTANGATTVHAADIDGDGDIDVLSTSENDDKLAWYENMGGTTVTFTDHIITTGANGAMSAYTGDVDGDGDIDILSASRIDNTVAWYENNGASPPSFTLHSVATSAISVRTVHAADLDNDGDLDILAGSASASGITWYENTAGDGSTFASHPITTTPVAGTRSVYAADVDGDGDLDVLSASASSNHIAWYENRGGQFALATTDTAPTLLIQGNTTDILQIIAAHRGRSGDGDAELATLSLLFEENAGDPLTSSETNALIETLTIYRDNGSGAFEPLADTLVATVATLSLTAGVQTVAFADGNANVQLTYGTPLTYFVVATLTADAADQTPNQFQITHITNPAVGPGQGSTVENRAHNLPLTPEFAPNVASSLCLAAAPPVTVDFRPERNSVIAPLHTPVTLTYNLPISPTSITSHTFAVHGMQSGLVTATHSVVSGNTLVVTPTPPFHQGELVYAVATTHTQSITGAMSLTPTLWQFNTGLVAPRCVSGFTEINVSSVLTGVRDGEAAWGDYDNDGDLDLLYTGDSSTRIAEVYRNDGGILTPINAGLTAVSKGGAAWGDYDNDGDLDILLVGSPTIAKVYRNEHRQGMPDTFTSINAGLTGVYGGAGVWGDYDGDGDLDILIAGHTGTTRITQLYRNESAQGKKDTFTDLAAGFIGMNDSTLAWGDHDSNGKLDFLIMGYTDGGMDTRIYFQDHLGNFMGRSNGLPVGNIGSVAWGDYDNDGDLDFLLTGQGLTGPMANVYRNDGGTLTTTVFTPIAAGLTGVNYSSAAWGDYDNDGDLDILLTGYNASNTPISKVYRNEAVQGILDTFTFIDFGLTGVWHSSALWGDYDGDGDLDILLTGYNIELTPTVKLYRNDDCPSPHIIAIAPPRNSHNVPLTMTVSTTYNEQINPASVTSYTFAVHATLTGLLTQTYAVNDVMVSLTPSQPFKPGEWVQVSATTGTLDLNGLEPISPTVWQFRTSVAASAGAFADSGQRLGSGNSYAAALGDLDGDGDLDALVSNNGMAEVWLNDGAAHFSANGQTLESLSGWGIALGDLDSDGDLDAFIAVGNSGADRVWFNNGTGQFTDSGQRLGSSSGHDVALGDLDGDGDLDAFVANVQSQPNQVWWNDGAGDFSGSGQSLGSAASYAVALGDLDNDGDLDAFVANGGPAPCEVWLNHQGIFTNSGQTLGNANSYDVALGDVDNDGDLDAFVANMGADSVWLNDSAGQFTHNGQSLGTDDSHAAALGDVDGDGDLDAVVGACCTGEAPNFVWRNNGAGVFVDSGQRLGIASTYDVALGDLDDDGDLDIFEADVSSSPNWVWLNHNPVIEVALSGPTSGAINTVYSFTATVSPVTATLPITYEWRTDTAAITHHVSRVTDTAVLSWPSPGVHIVTVTAMNLGSSVVETHTLILEPSAYTLTIATAGDGHGIITPTTGAYTYVSGTTVLVTATAQSDSIFEGWQGACQDATPTCAVLLNGDKTLTATFALNTCPHPVSDISITGPTSGYTDTEYTFTSAIVPVNATTPLTYTWRIDEVDAGQAASLAYTWPTPGVYTLTLRAENCGDAVTATHVITIVAPSPGCPRPLSSVSIAGPTNGYTDTEYTFTSAIVPPDATTPLTYTWQINEVDAGQAASLAYTWPTPGVYTLTLRAENCGGIVTATHIITIISSIGPAAPLSVAFSGPTSGTVGTAYSFQAVVNPTATLPFTYTWYATQQATVHHPSRMAYSDEVTFTWATYGPQSITVTVANAQGGVTDTFNFVVTPGESGLRAAKSVVPAGTVYPGSILTYTLTLSNPGAQTLTGLHLQDRLPTVTTYLGGSLGDGASYDLAAHAINWVGTLFTTTTDGPGYTLNSVAYQWTEIAATGNVIFDADWQGNGDSGWFGPIPLGFDFPYFQDTQVYTQVYVATNGYIGFGPTDNYDDMPEMLPHSGSPNNLIAPYADNLYIDPDKSKVYYQPLSNPPRFIVEYKAAQDKYLDGLNAYYTFQVILYPTGEIRFVYSGGAAASFIGLENGTGTRGLNYSPSVFGTNRALHFTPREFRRFIYTLQVSEDVFNDGWLTNTVSLNSAQGSLSVDRAVWLKVPPDSYEPNGTCTAAHPVSPTTVLTSYLSRANDMDTYRVTLPLSYTMVAITLTSPVDAEVAVALFDGECATDGTPRHRYTPWNWDTPRHRYTGPGAIKAILYNIGPYTGAYHIQVTGVDGQWSTSPYTLEIATWQGTPFPDPDVSDVCAASTWITPGIAISGTIEMVTDTDHYAFAVLEPNTQVIITLTSVFSYDLDLYDGCIEAAPRHRYTPYPWTTDHGESVKTILYNVGPYTGTYYVKVYGFEGAYNADNPYWLEVAFSYARESGVKTLILYNTTRLRRLYGNTATEAVVAKLRQLAATDEVQGRLVAVDEDAVVRAAYDRWDADPTNAARANDVSIAIKTMLLATLGGYPDLDYMVIVGNDSVVPFRRAPDETEFREHTYVGFGNVDAGTTTGAALAADYFLSDDFYADRSASWWDFGRRDLYIPDFAVGRLVETPTEITAFIDAFLANSQTQLTRSLVAGHVGTQPYDDFLVDASILAADRLLTHGGGTVATLIGPQWKVTDLHQEWLQQRTDLAVLNLHANHWGLSTSQDPTGLESSMILTASASLTRAVYTSLGCHAGLNIPDQDSNAYTTLDLAQTLARRGANWIANTGYGVGGDATPYSEQLMLFLNEELTQGSQQTLGAAWSRAKERYYLSMPETAFGYLDEKVLGELVFYGLPMYTLNTALPRAQLQDSHINGVAVSPWSLTGETLQQRRDYTLTLNAVSVITLGTYFEAVNPDLGAGTYAQQGQPIQPRLVDPVSATVRGVVFESGVFTTTLGFDPWVTRLGHSDTPLTAESELSGTQWRPAQVATIRELETLSGTQKTLVLVPGQYRPTDAQQWVYQQVSVSLYASSLPDQTPPTITSVQHTVAEPANLITVTVVASDTIGIQRVLVTCATLARSGAGHWKSQELVPRGGGTWQGQVTGQGALEYFVQVVDTAGNVTVGDNEGRYYTVTLSHRLYLPLVLRGQGLP